MLNRKLNLKSLLHPISEGEFARDYLGRKPLHILDANYPFPMTASRLSVGFSMANILKRTSWCALSSRHKKRWHSTPLKY